MTDERVTPAAGEWQAVANLSVSRKDEKDRMADPHAPGDIVTLTQEQARHYLEDFRVPMIRRPSDGPLPSVTAWHAFVRPPSASQFGVRPDPPGSSNVIRNPSDPEQHPEASEPKPQVVDQGVTRGRRLSGK